MDKDFIEVTLDDANDETFERMRQWYERAGYTTGTTGLFGKGWNDARTGKWKTRSYLMTDRGMLRIRRGPLGWLRRRRARRIPFTPLCGPARYSRPADAD